MDKKNPTVSVILPTYNRAKLIDRAIKSILGQTYQDFELIIVDDGSNDNTKDFVNAFDDRRIRYVRHEENKGANAARNTGIAMARGGYVAFQDSDDEWLPEKLEKQMQIFKNTSVGVVYTGFWRIKGNEKIYIPSPTIEQKEGNIHHRLLHGNFVTTQAAVIKRECFNKAGLFDESLPRLQDWELFIRISKHYLFKCVDEPLVISYFTSKSISANQEALISAHLYILEKHYDDLKMDNKLLAYHHFNIGNLLYLSGDFDRGKTFLRKALRTDPLNFKYLGAVLASMLGKDVYRYATEFYKKKFNAI
jgi:glycosyltransferase involved in cell wall biosynthesis